MSSHLTYLEAVVTGLIQGVTELFPVSSLGHNVLIPALIGGSWANALNVSAPNSPYLAFIVGLHVATAIAMIAYFWRDWLRIVRGFFSSLRKRSATTPDERLAWMIILATIPVGIVGASLQKVFVSVFAKPELAALFLAINGVILLVSERMRRSRDAARAAAAAPAMAGGAGGAGRAGGAPGWAGGPGRAGGRHGGPGPAGYTQQPQQQQWQGSDPRYGQDNEGQQEQRGNAQRPEGRPEGQPEEYGRQPGYPQGQPGYPQAPRPGYPHGQQPGYPQAQYGAAGQYGPPGQEGPQGRPGQPGQGQYGGQYGQGQYGQGRGQHGQGQYGQEQYGQEQYGQEQYGQGQYGQGQYGRDPRAGQPAPGQPPVGDPRDPRGPQYQQQPPAGRGAHAGAPGGGHGGYSGGHTAGRGGHAGAPGGGHGGYNGGHTAGRGPGGGQDDGRPAGPGGTPAADPAVAADGRLSTMGYKRAVLVGSAQILALLPGISRDGIVTVTGMGRGLRREDAVRFSFLLSAPVILAAGALKAKDLTGPLSAGIHGPILVGSLISGVGAYLSIRFLTKYFSEDKSLSPFGIYCLIAGLGSLVYLLLK
jgi:undecaprenyl pyrophosphate phosphatase UppP